MNKLEDRVRGIILTAGFIGIQAISVFHIAQKDYTESILSIYNHPHIEIQVPLYNSKTGYMEKEPPSSFPEPFITKKPVKNPKIDNQTPILFTMPVIDDDGYLIKPQLMYLPHEHDTVI